MNANNYFSFCKGDLFSEYSHEYYPFITQLLHKGGPFINSLLHLEELGFRSSSPTIKKIAFIAWKSLIDNFALNPGVTLL